MNDNYSTDQFKATHMFDEIVWHLRTNLAVKTNRSKLMTAENSFTGKDALDFLIFEVPRIVPGKVPTKENMVNLLEMMIEWKVIAEAFPKKAKQHRPFSEARIYVFAKSIDELMKPKPRSRRSASFSGGRKSTNDVQAVPSVETIHRLSKATAPRRLSQSNGNISRIGNENDSRGVENPGFDDQKDDENQRQLGRKLRPPNILNRSLESICKDHMSVRRELPNKKEKVYDWLPFFKSRRYQSKNNQKPRRSISLDRNHCMVEEENAEAARNKQKITSPPIHKVANDLVFLHPQGPFSKTAIRCQNHRTSLAGVTSVSLSRGRMYESIMRKSSIVPVVEHLSVLNDGIVWKTELISKLKNLYGDPLPSEWVSKVDGYDIQWNMQEIDPNDGVVRSRCSGLQPDYPQTVIHFMDYLSRYPFCSLKKTEIVQEHNIGRMFGTLVNRLEDLNAPLQADDCTILVSLLSKMDNFDTMLETGAVRRWSKVMVSSSSSITDAGLMVDGFARELPACGIRASKHRRRALSPLDNRLHLPIRDEKAYKIREQWLIESIQLVLLSLPTSRRRKLHKFVSFIKSIETNEVFDIADPSNGSSNNREAAIIGLWTGVCGGCRKQHGIMITAVLLANFRSLFAVPGDFVEYVRRLEQDQNEYYETRYLNRARSHKVSKPSVLEELRSPSTITKNLSKNVAVEKSKKGLFTRLLRK